MVELPAGEDCFYALLLWILSLHIFILLLGSLKELRTHSVRIRHHVMTHVFPILILCRGCDLFALLLLKVSTLGGRLDDLWLFYLSLWRDELSLNVFFRHLRKDFHTFAN